MKLDMPARNLTARLLNVAVYKVTITILGGVSVDWSETCLHLTGATATELQDESRVRELFGEFFDLWRARISQVMASGTSGDWEHTIFRDGQELSVRHLLSRLDGRRAIGILELRAPLTASHYSKSLPWMSRKGEADTSSHAWERNLAALSHEVQTPMNAILGLSRQILKTGLTSKQREYMGHISSAARYLMYMFTNLLHFFKIDADKIDLESTPFTLRELVSIQEVMFRAKAMEKGIELEFYIDDDAPEVLHGDFMRVSQIVSNLVGNSLKFTERGGVYIWFSLVKADAESAVMRFSVSDTGIGMTRSQQQRIFDAFYQGDPSISRRYGGTGLGLYIAKHLVEKMNGSIAVQSIKGEGTTITFTCPFAVEEKDGLLTREQPVAPPLFSGERILLVDDNPLNREIAVELLHEVNLQVTTAGNGREALELLAKGEDATGSVQPKYALVFMDLQMPAMDGCQAVSIMREKNEFAELPVIAMSASTTESENERCMMAGMNDFIAKPIDVEVLYGVLRRYLKEAEQGKVG